MSIKQEDDEVAGGLRVAVLTSPRVYLTSKLAEEVQNKISWCILNRFKQYFNYLPRFKGNPVLEDGIIYFKCFDTSSFNILQQYFSKYSESNYTRLFISNFKDVFFQFERVDKIPKLIKCTIMLRDYTNSNAEFHDLLNAQNKNFNVDKWFYFGHRRQSTSLSPLIVTYYIPEGIVAEMQKKNFELSFGFGCVTLEVCKLDSRISSE